MRVGSGSTPAFIHRAMVRVQTSNFSATRRVVSKPLPFLARLRGRGGGIQLAKGRPVLKASMRTTLRVSGRGD
jgi:hypothetical protein